jgi:hypothetical protein
MAKRKAPPLPPPPPDAGWFTGLRTWAVAGAVLVGGVIVWKLVGSSYKADVETICNAEAGSGFTYEKDTSKVTAYIRAHLATPEGNTFYSTLSDAKLADRAKKLQVAASDLHVGACPTVAAFEKMAANGDYRSDIVHLCSQLSYPHLAEVDDAERLKTLEDWIAASARSPRTKELGAALVPGTPAERAKVLRDTAQAADVFACENAKTLEGPVVPAKVKGPPKVRIYAEPQIMGDMNGADLAKAVLQVTPALEDCYRTGLKGKPELAGKIAMKLKIDAAGKVISAHPADTAPLDPDTAKCMGQVLEKMEAPKNPGPLVSVLLPFELTTLTAPGPAAPGSGAPAGSSVPPAGSSSAAPAPSKR